jgi:DNA-directed RNA polymerase subunit F
MRSGEKLGTALAKVSEDSVNDTALTDALHKALHYLQQYGGPAADDTVREMIQHYDANQAVDQLSKLSPDLLSEMKLILQQGDDTALNQQMLNDFVDPAIAASRTTE